VESAATPVERNAALNAHVPSRDAPYHFSGSCFVGHAAVFSVKGDLEFTASRLLWEFSRTTKRRGFGTANSGRLGGQAILTLRWEESSTRLARKSL
jgi:hypothetical protein